MAGNFQYFVGIGSWLALDAIAPNRSDAAVMSFFGFDSSLPPAGSQLEERLATYEETDIYDFGGDAYHDLLAAKLDEGAINDFNDETFGAEQLETAPVGQSSRCCPIRPTARSRPLLGRTGL